MTMIAGNFMPSLSWLILVVIFIVLLIVITKTLRQTAIFSDRIAFILAICVSLLSVLGISRQFGSIGTDGDITKNGDKVEPNSLDFILIPYTAMALAILLMLLLLAIVWLVNAKTNFRHHQHIQNEIKRQTTDPQEKLSKPCNSSIAPSKKEESFRNKLLKL
jgi:hypothetical protein